MELVRIWGRGQLTIPKRIRKELGLREGSVPALLKVGDVLILVPRQLGVERMADRAMALEARSCP